MEEMVRLMRDYERRIERLETTAERGIYVPWTPYHDTSTITGWSSFTAKEIYYSRDGRLVFVAFNLSGVSDSTSTHFTLPIDAIGSSLTNFRNLCERFDNGTAGTGVAEITPAAFAGRLRFKPAPGGSITGWTASGTKAVTGMTVYEAA